MKVNIMLSSATHVTKCYGSGQPDCNCEGCFNRRLLEEDSEDKYGKN